MSPIKTLVPAVLAALLAGGCATRPANPPITQVDHSAGYRFETRLSSSACSNSCAVPRW